MPKDREQIPELMLGAKERYRTTHANHPRVAGREDRRRGARTVHCEAYRRTFGHEPCDRMLPRREPEDFERVWRVGHERPDRWPQEVELPDDSGTEYRVIDSRSFWSYSPRDGAHAAATASGTFGPEFEIAYVFDPDSGAPDLSYLEMRAVGRIRHAGREALRVEAHDTRRVGVRAGAHVVVGRRRLRAGSGRRARHDPAPHGSEA